MCVCMRVCVWMYVCVCVFVSASAHGVEKKALDPLELELQTLVSSLMWVLGTKLWSSAKAFRTLKH